MTQADREPQPAEPRATARIDDFLVERHQTRHNLCAILDAIAPGRPLTRQNLRGLCRKVRQAGPGALRELVRICIEDTHPQCDTAMLILSSFRTAEMLEPVMDRIRDPGVRRLSKIRLLGALPARFENHELLAEIQAHIGASPTDVLHLFSEALSSSMEPEDIAHLWLTDMGALPVDDRVRYLGLLAKQRNPRLLPILELEAYSLDVEARRAVAANARLFPFAESVELARKLETDFDPTVRYNAHDSLAVLGVAAALPHHRPLPRFERCCWLASPGNGTAALVYITRCGPAKRKLCALLLETFHLGVLETWGNADASEAEINEFLGSFSARVAAYPHLPRDLMTGLEEIPREHALYLIDSAVRLAERRGNELPAEFHVWEPLFRHETWEFDPAGSPMIFDLHCSDCAKPIKPNRRSTNFLVQDGHGWCRPCLNRKRFCRQCHRPYRLADAADGAIPELARDRVCSQCLAGMPGCTSL